MDHYRREPPRTLVVLGHPRPGSFCAALADGYAEGARAAGAEVRRLDLADCCFDGSVATPSPLQQPLEPDLVAAKDLIAWAEHLVFVFPTWWGTMPALLKGFLDRVLLPGFAFAEKEDPWGFKGLLEGRSAHLITTMDTPGWVYRWIYGAPGLNGLARATLGFCGIEPVRRTVFSGVKPSNATVRAAWVAAARREGEKLADGVLTPRERLWRRAAPWIAALRLQFHPMAWAAYALGAAAAPGFSWSVFLLGLVAFFFLEVATVMTNDLFDLPSDRVNRYHGPFTGGSRVLVEGRITPVELRAAAIGGFLAFAVTGLVLQLAAPDAPVLPLLVLFAVLAIGYTAPPLRLSWRGLGELNVAFTHSVLLVLCGWAFQGGGLWTAPPWLLGLPLLFAVFGAIALSGLPDATADSTAGKRTLAVRLGPGATFRLVQASVLLAALVALALAGVGAAGGAFAGIWVIVPPHAGLLLWRLERHRRRETAPERIDGLMALALTYIVWFAAVPLWRLL